MTFLFPAFAVSLAALFLWAVISPRGQWKALASWSYRDPYRSEPGPVAFGLYRATAAVGVIAVGVTAFVAYRPNSEAIADSSRSLSAVEQMWGAPAPRVVNRVVIPLSEAPENLVAQPVLGYQEVQGATRQPVYLFGLAAFVRKDAVSRNGYIGVPPSPGLLALDTASLVVHVRGDKRCIPQQVVVVESSRSVKIGVFFGQLNPSGGSNAAHASDCDPRPSKAKSVSLLLPIHLVDSVGVREVLSLDGKPLHEVKPID